MLSGLLAVVVLGFIIFEAISSIKQKKFSYKILKYVLFLVIVLLSGFAGEMGSLFLIVGFWSVFFMIPMGVEVQLSRFIEQGDYDLALSQMQILAFFNPYGKYLKQYKVFKMLLNLSQSNNYDTDSEILKKEACNSDINPLIMPHVYINLFLWDEFISWYENTKESKIKFVHYYMIALGETGQLDKMISTYREYENVINKSPELYYSVLSCIFAYLGEVDNLKTTIPLNNKFSTLYDTNKIMIATSHFVSGDEYSYNKMIDEILSSENTLIITKKFIEKRQKSSLLKIVEDIESENIFTTVDAINKEYNKEIEATHKPSENDVPVLTISLMVILGLCFLPEIPGGANNVENIYKLGGFLFPDSLFNFEIWRFFTCSFLHFGFLHLGFNLLALWIFGRPVEIAIKKIGFLAIYISSVFGSALFYALICLIMTMLTGELTPTVLAGASGGVMGLLGGYLSIVSYNWIKNKAKIAQKNLYEVIGLIGIQFVYDIMTPHVSPIPHLSGLFVGFVVGLIFTLIMKPKIVSL